MLNIRKMRLAVLVFSIVLLAGLTSAWAGGFWIEAQTPTSESAERGIVAVIHPEGCHQPSDAVFQGAAEGLVNGRRQTVRLKLSVNASGSVEVQQTWPKEGVWVLAITANYRGMTRSLLLPVGDSGEEFAKSQMRRAPTGGEIESALRELASGSRIGL